MNYQYITVTPLPAPLGQVLDENSPYSKGVHRELALALAAPELFEALLAAKKMNDEALPKFNWGASFLDANAIQLLNETPGKINAAIAKAEGRQL